MSVSGPCLAQPPPLHHWTPLCWYTAHFFYCPLQHPFLSRYFLTSLSNLSDFLTLPFAMFPHSVSSSILWCHCHVRHFLVLFHTLPFSIVWPLLHLKHFLSSTERYTYIYLYIFSLFRFLNARPVLNRSLSWLSVLPKWTTLYFNWRIFIIIFKSQYIILQTSSGKVKACITSRRNINRK